MVRGIHIDMITEVHMAMIANPFDWWFDSGATVHGCNGTCVQQQRAIQVL